jgi:glycosyltransferase involved in cell wall biosynthesis
MHAIIIPAYKPDFKLSLLIEKLIALNFTQIIVIDDGSGIEYKSLFSSLESSSCFVIHHTTNLGKGAAIKSGIKYLASNLPKITGFITCDGDGQHQPKDIEAVSLALEASPDSLILGSRDLKLKIVPLKSRLGNAFSSFYFKMTTGITCHDTQTGLRGIPLSLIELALSIPENRYDYEMIFLTRSAKEGTTLEFVPIETVYLNDNSSSHFRPVVDSIRIYKEPIKFAFSSLLSAGVDLGIFTILTTILDDNIVKIVFIATVVARIISGLLNFLLNRLWSFKNTSSIKNQFKRYFALYILQLTLSIVFVSLLAFIPIHLTLIKLIVDSMLFIGSFFIQKNWVFKHHKY